MIIAGKHCEDCIHGTLDESNPAKIMAYCDIRERWFIYGTSIQCEYRELRNNDRTEEVLFEDLHG